MSLTKREKLLITILAFVVIIGGFSYFILFPKLNSLEEKSKILSREERILNNLQKTNKEGTITNMEEALQKEINEIEEVLPTQVRIPEIYLTLLEIVTQSGVKQESFTIENTLMEEEEREQGENSNKEKTNVKLQEKLLVLPINHEIRGTYEEIEKYINRIQASKRKIDIIEYQIFKNKDMGNNRISASFSLQSYALVKEGQNLSEFTNYDFLKDHYGREDPFYQKSNKEVEKEDINKVEN